MVSIYPLFADNIEKFNSSWIGKTLIFQRSLNLDALISENNILGTHNSYNSSKYWSLNLSKGFRYPDPQQKYSIKDQLRTGSRFIELDVHWTNKMESPISYPKRHLLCHGVCSINDKYFHEALYEIKDWINSKEAYNQVIILYIENHMDNHYRKPLKDIKKIIGDYIYPSGEYHDIPPHLTKRDILEKGKNILLWIDNLTCDESNTFKGLAFQGLGKIKRIWEDRTKVNKWIHFLKGKKPKYIEALNIISYQKKGINIINLDNLTINDKRLEAFIWSWGKFNPHPENDKKCTISRKDGRWENTFCYEQYNSACFNISNNTWKISHQSGDFDEASKNCERPDYSYKFIVPTNRQENESLKKIKNHLNINNVWINYKLK